MLQLTGFVLPDVGILTITELVGKSDPSQITREDLDWVANYLEEFYIEGWGRSLLKRLFPNSGFDQSSLSKEKRKVWADFVLRGYDETRLEAALDAMGKDKYRAMVLSRQEEVPRCTFSGNPAYLRVTRTMMPMLNAQDTINFSPMGQAGIPVSAPILLAIHAMPLGCISTKGKLLAVESSDYDLMRQFVKENLEMNLKFMSLASQDTQEGYLNISNYKTYLIDILAKSQAKAERHVEGGGPAPSVTAYYFTNDNRGALVDIYYLPSSTIAFVRTVSHGQYADAWGRIVSSGWTQEKEESEELKSKTPKLTRRNFIYEDLFDLPKDARKFLGTYFLRRSLKEFKNDPRAEHNPFAEADLVSWKLTALFLRSIMNMEESRIEQIKDLGTRLADYIHKVDNRKLLQALYRGGNYRNFRIVLLRAIQDYSRNMPRESEPLVAFDSYIKIFEEGDGFEKIDFNLARDLLLIRIFEQLHRAEYLSNVADELEDNNEINEDSALSNE